MLWGIISLNSCKTVLKHRSQKENVVLKNHKTLWEPLIQRSPTAFTSQPQNHPWNNLEVSLSQTSPTCDDKLFHSFMFTLQTHWAGPAGLSPEINFRVNSFFLYLSKSSQLFFCLDETNLQAAFDKLVFVELAIFVDVKLVEHHLRILLCSVLEK